MILATLAGNARNSLSVPYPEAPSDNTVDSYFGMTAKDTFRPLENDTAAATTRWVEAENALTSAYLLQIPFREKIKQRLTELNNYHRNGLPYLENDGKYYVYENDGLRNQSILYRMDKPGGKMELFLDPNTLSEDGTVALTGVYQSPSGKYTAYTISRSGSDWTEIYVMETATKRLLPDHIVWAKFTGAA
ncbi:MAG: S9 family peptidase, partial [Muribaculaceae bacterium]|nr:S9 family peptidase [Muribaculaceae bacterium]